MKHKLGNKILIPCAIVLFALLCLLTLSAERKGSVVIIRKNSHVIDTVDLSKLTEPYVLDLGTNQILFDGSGVRMKSSTCPDKLCVKQGRLREGTGTIVCLPNRIMIELAERPNDVDAVAGSR